MDFVGRVRYYVYCKVAQDNLFGLAVHVVVPMARRHFTERRAVYRIRRLYETASAHRLSPSVGGHVQACLLFFFFLLFLVTVVC